MKEFLNETFPSRKNMAECQWGSSFHCFFLTVTNYWSAGKLKMSTHFFCQLIFPDTLFRMFCLQGRLSWTNTWFVSLFNMLQHLNFNPASPTGGRNPTSLSRHFLSKWPSNRYKFMKISELTNWNVLFHMVVFNFL